MNESSNTSPPDSFTAAPDAESELAAARAEIERLTAELSDLQMLYEAMIEHGEAVEDQLADKNIELEKTQERLAAELADAARYVFSILPAKRDAGPATDWLLIPSTELGGDSFGYHDIDAEHFAIYLLDVCGHGVGAALLSATAINLMRASALSNADFRDPSSVLAALNATFPMERQNGMFFTIWYGVYNRKTGMLQYATGGHPPAILMRGDGSADQSPELLITMGNIVIGAFPDMDYECGSVEVRAGDRLLVLSDGTFEVNGPDEQELSVEILARYAARECAAPARIHEWVRSFNDEGPLPDDFSILEVRF
jgi:sigma-B regulation protein RsbU (phosphoserine phosphatase)